MALTQEQQKRINELLSQGYSKTPPKGNYSTIKVGGVSVYKPIGTNASKTTATEPSTQTNTQTQQQKATYIDPNQLYLSYLSQDYGANSSLYENEKILDRYAGANKLAEALKPMGIYNPTFAQLQQIGNNLGINYDGSLNSANAIIAKLKSGVSNVNATSNLNAGVFGPSNYTGNSITDYLRSVNQPADYSSRTKLAQQYGIQNYTGTAQQNTQLLSILRNQPVASTITQIKQQFPNYDINGTGVDTGTKAGQSAYNQQQQNTSTTGNVQLDQLLGTLKSYLDLQTAAGKKVNPNIVLDAATMDKFLTQASNEIDPYYASQIKAIKSDLVNNFDEMKANYDLAMEGQQSNFRESLGLQRESEAGKGTLFSGGRKTRADELVAKQNRNLKALESQYLSNARQTGTTAERQLGSQNLAGFTAPTINTYTASLSGLGGLSPLTSKSLYSLTGDVYGTLPAEQKTATETRRSQLESLYRNQNSLY